MEKKRIFIFAINEESNSFNPTFASFNDFIIKKSGEWDNDDALGVRGALKAMAEDDMTPVFGPYFWSMSGAGAPLKDELINELFVRLEQDLKTAGQIDGVSIIFHGATVSETREDVCGDVSEFVRKLVGDELPITASFDLHANITEKLTKNVNFICGFQKYPHLDIFETGYRSVKMLGEYFKDNRVKTYFTRVPVIASASGYTTDSKELKALMEKGKNYVNQGKILDFSVFQVQPWLDVTDFASTIIAIGKDDCATKEIVKELAEDEFNLKESLQDKNFLTVEEIIEIARKNKTGKPIVICDSADSPNAGATGDSPFVLEKLLPVKDEFEMAVAVTDLKAVDQAFALGVGGVGDFTVGGSICPKIFTPVLVRNATVKCLSDGEFTMYGPQERGIKKSIGKCAVIQTGKLKILLSYDGKREGDRGFYRFVGIEPELMDIVDIKACTSFRAGYESISAGIYNVASPGAASPVLTTLPFEKRPKPLYPFEPISLDMIAEPKTYR